MSFISRGSIGASAGIHALSNDELRKLAPSIFAEDKHVSRSARYTYVPTIEIVDGMRAQGFFPVSAKQGNSRVPGKADFTKHMIRFRLEGDQNMGRSLGGVFPEVAIVNAHDGTASYQAMAGLMRQTCLNGLLVAERDLTSIKVGHTGNITDKVIDASFSVIEESKAAIGHASAWSQLRLTNDEAGIFANAAHVLRFADDEGRVTTPIEPVQLLRARRQEDASPDLWTTFNRVQENAIRGGLSAMARNDEGTLRRYTTREVKGIDGDVKLNRALWLLAEQMAELKGVKAAA